MATVVPYTPVPRDIRWPSSRNATAAIGLALLETNNTFNRDVLRNRHPWSAAAGNQQIRDIADHALKLHALTAPARFREDGRPRSPSSARTGRTYFLTHPRSAIEDAIGQAEQILRAARKDLFENFEGLMPYTTARVALLALDSRCFERAHLLNGSSTSRNASTWGAYLAFFDNGSRALYK